jgi:hypothetical protein
MDEVDKPSTTTSTEKSNCSLVSRKRQLESSAEGTELRKSEEEQSLRKRRSGTAKASAAYVDLSSSDDADSVNHSKRLLRSKSGRLKVEGITKPSRGIELRNRDFVEVVGKFTVRTRGKTSMTGGLF